MGSEATTPDPEISRRKAVKPVGEVTDIQWLYCKFIDNGGIDRIGGFVVPRWGQCLFH